MCGRVVSAAVVEKDPIKRRASVVMTKDPSGKIRMCRLDEEITGIRVCLECWKVVERQEMRVFIPRYMRAYKVRCDSFTRAMLTHVDRKRFC